MGKIVDYAKGWARVRVTGAEPTAFLDKCLERRLRFWAVKPVDDFTLELCMDIKDAEKAEAAGEKCFCQVEIPERFGGPILKTRAKRRVVMFIVPLLLVMAFTAASFFVWRIEIDGAETVSETAILNALADQGVEIGSYWPSFNSELIRSGVLEGLPELKWIGVSLYGSRVHVVVREKTPVPELFDESAAVRLVAGRGGLIEEMRVLRGAGKVKAGDTAAEGDILIDSVVESPFAGARLVHASGSVRARTWYELTAVMPMEQCEKVSTGRTKTRIAVKIGDKRINFYANSGIWQEKCDNIITEKTLGVRGAFALPVTMIKETLEEYEIKSRTLSRTEASEKLEETLREELSYRLSLSHGEMVKVNFTFSVSGDLGVGTLRAECLEDIASEELISQEETEQILAEAEREDSTEDDREDNDR